jgi:ubiquinone/menaquinone biosynthesis C-methylase UbiE
MDWQVFWDEKASASTDFQATGRGLMGVPGYLYTVAEIVRLLDLRQGERLVDVGCGVGLIALSLSPWLSHIDAIDISPNLIARAKDNLSGVGNVNARVGSLTEIPLPENCFDKLLAYSVLQYLGGVDAVSQAFREVSRVLKPGGKALMAANPDPERRYKYEEILMKRSDGLAVQRELAILDDLLWLSGDVLTTLAQAEGLEAFVTPLSPRIWQHFYMFDLVLKKPN